MQLTSLVEMHSEAARELLDRVEVETVHYINVTDDSKITEKESEIAALMATVSKLEDDLKDALSNKEKPSYEASEVFFYIGFEYTRAIYLLLIGMSHPLVLPSWRLRIDKLAPPNDEF